MNQPAKLEVETLRRLNRLCELEARPPAILALLPNLKEAFVRAQWMATLGKAPPRGPLPLKEDFYFSSYQNRLEGSYFIRVWQQLIDAQFHYVDAYIGAYEQYSELFGDKRLMSFDRAWCLARAVASEQLKITVVQCDACSSFYIHNVNDLINHRNCPVCRLCGLRETARNRQKTREIDGEDLSHEQPTLQIAGCA